MSEIEQAIAYLQESVCDQNTEEGRQELHNNCLLTAIAALREKLERENGCEWCAGDTEWQPDVLDGCSGGYRKPKFCPECGKHLKGSGQHE